MTTSAQGKDVSDFQPPQTAADWQNLDFGFAKASEGGTWTGQTFPANWASMKKAGIARGAYHFLHPDGDPAAQARHFLTVIKNAGGLVAGDMLVVDSEVYNGLSGDGVDRATLGFLTELAKNVNAAHHPLLTYTMHDVGQHLKLTAAAFPELWFAHPGTSSPSDADIAPFRKWRFWQWGITGGLDRDAFNGTAADLDTWLAKFEDTGPAELHVARRPAWTDVPRAAEQVRPNHRDRGVVLEYRRKP